MKPKTHTNHHILAAFLTLMSVYAIVFSSAVLPKEKLHSAGAQLTALLPQQAFHQSARTWQKHSMPQRIATRLQSRLDRTWGISPSIASLTEAIEHRQKLLKHATAVSVQSPEGIEYVRIDVSMQADPLLLMPAVKGTLVDFVVDEERIRQTLHRDVFSTVLSPEDIAITAVFSDEHGVRRAETTGVARAGWSIDEEGATQTVINSLRDGAPLAELSFELRDGQVANQTGEFLGNLELLATGKSNFKGSTYARIANVRKALREHVQNIVVAPGEEFSFNSTLGGPVTQSRGWHMAKIIVNGDQLEFAPGGGICQASTTVYRAIVEAGFPVIERRSHSLYVSYYEEYGVGIDATIFPGSQDLVFLNDSPDYLLVQAYDDGFDAVVNIYGTKDGRIVDLQGPFFAQNAPDGLLVNGRDIRPNEIAWTQRVMYPDGRQEENVIVSAYRSIPNAIRNEYAFAE